MRASLKGREELAARVQRLLDLATKKEAERVVETVVAALEATLLNNLETDGFTLKLGGFGKFSVRHKPGIVRRIPFTGEELYLSQVRGSNHGASLLFNELTARMQNIHPVEHRGFAFQDGFLNSQGRRVFLIRTVVLPTLFV